ncbi:GNAT family N-acetyltransferase [Deinococcus sp. KNUC1210]|uniref:GNAT family N-acetyltransferase n=1 Tax=Deinococcus sp. KNUC1210 TaxID=2917691 RepID=UPI001EF02B52|nr:GNAT family N-acetyltransferase [Deinococcus sp. KNUC1210]ULH14545.1 GNAT family N-acetyltransferase [Deinococcus sp. KNUC1210]
MPTADSEPGASLSTPIQIRAAVAGDAEQMANVHIHSWRETYTGLMPPGFLTRMTDDRMRDLRGANWRRTIHDADDVVCVAVHAGQVVGFASGGALRPHTVIPGDYSAEVYTLYALKSVQGQGLGRRLLSEVAKGLEERAYRGMALWVLASNPTRQFYTHLGGAELGQKIEETPFGPLTEVALGWRHLDLLIRPD